MKKTLSLFLLIILTTTIQAQYISEVLEYKPAPGQFTNDGAWGTPESAQSLVGGINGHLSLGAFGGYVVFKFESPVENDPENPYGVDFTILGNPLVSAIYHIVTWSEHGIVSVMKDENGNGLPDDTWYELAGSDYFFSTTLKNYSVTYSNPNEEEAADVPWTDNLGNSGFVYANNFHFQSYYPDLSLFPDINSVEYTLTGTRVEDDVDKTDPSYVMSFKKAFGYVDNQRVNFTTTDYLIPDNPYTLEAENSGGDAFDISWAVDENGDYVDLDVIHFVKVHNGILADAGWLGEISTEIRGAIDIPANNEITGVMDMVVIKHLPDTIRGSSFQVEAAVFENGRYNPNAVINWTSNLTGVSVDNNNLLNFTESGELMLTASLEGKPAITAMDSTVLIYEPSGVNELFTEIKVHPNPAKEYISISGIRNAEVSIFDISGKQVSKQSRYSEGELLSVSKFCKGVYFIKVVEQNISKTLRFVKY